MSDNLQKRGPADRIRIDTDQEYERRQWAKKFGVTPKELVDAVKKVGPMVDDVKRELGK
ncbi:MAG: DUF3606 domain-containing protein [Alphaproteobacteria bacterium]